jgi:DNA-binding response OmpR family regulator
LLRASKLPRILVVEDQELLAEISLNCAPTMSQMPLSFWLGAAIELVLLDCVLPGGTTWQVVLEADRQTIPVVLMADDSIQMIEVAGGSRPFLLKPFSFGALRDVVERTIGPVVG